MQIIIHITKVTIKDQGGMSRKPLYEEKKVKVLKSKRKNLYNLTLAEFLVSTFN